MTKTSEITKPYFSHDYTPLADKNLLKLFITLGAEGYGIYWLVVEFMHQNSFVVGEEELLAYKFRIDKEKIIEVMNDFGLFQIEEKEGERVYVSDRILRNLNYAEEKSARAKKTVEIRWLLSAFNKSYVEFFGEEPILTSGEIENLKKYNDKIPDLKSKLRDILYTLKTLKFDTDTNFVPCANWLLKDNNMARLVNGEWGKLKHKKTQTELREERKRLQIEEEERNKPSELELEIEQISDKETALKFIGEFYKDKELIIQRGKVFLLPTLRTLTGKFGITDSEIADICGKGKSL